MDFSSFSHPARACIMQHRHEIEHARWFKKKQSCRLTKIRAKDVLTSNEGFEELGPPQRGWIPGWPNFG
jgi:hypothetical protein